MQHVNKKCSPSVTAPKENEMMRDKIHGAFIRTRYSTDNQNQESIIVQAALGVQFVNVTQPMIGKAFGIPQTS